MRATDLREGRTLCLEVYAVRRLWRITGRVAGRERVTLPLGVYQAWHLEGEAIRIDRPDRPPRKLHAWISDDARRLPLTAMGVTSDATVRATLDAHRRPGEVRERSKPVPW